MITDQESCCILSSPEYDNWLRYFVNNDVQSAKKEYDRADDEEKNKLLNGRFPTLQRSACDSGWSPRFSKSTKQTYVAISSPAEVAIVYGSLDIVKFLLDNNVDLCKIDESGNNAFHVLIKVAAQNIDEEKKYLGTLRFLINTLSTDSLSCGLLCEDANGLRPIEVAAKHGTFCLMVHKFILLLIKI